MGGVDLEVEFATFTRSAWRLCSRDEYDVGGAEIGSILEWRQTGYAPEPDNGWLPIVRAARRRGATVGRVQVLSRPLTEYARWLLSIYPQNILAGEDVSIAYRDEHPDRLADLCRDFWLFDDERVVVLHYDAHGCFLGAVNGSTGLDYYRRLRDLAVAVARPMGHAAVA